MQSIKKLILFLFACGLIAVMAAAGLLVYAMQSTNSPGPLQETKIVLIERGKGVSAIAQILEDEGVINSALIMKGKVFLDGDARALKAGEYEFLANVSMVDALEMMREGKVYERKITVPEGLTAHQIVALLDANEDLTGDTAAIPEDGTLLPETYHYIKGDTRQSMLNEMSASMTATIAELWPTRTADAVFKTEKEMITLASVVEKETGVAAERAKVAGVFINRLKMGMPLQSDPTVIYGITMGDMQDDGQGPLGRRLLSKDLETPSPYNTYLNPGLPPGPIANPGRASIEAVLHPEEHNFLYFVADGKGGHAFARTLAEHNANVANWRRIRQAQ